MTQWDSLPDKYKDQDTRKIDVENYDKDDTKLIIPGEFPTMNEIINKSKTHWTKYREMKQSYDDTVAFYADKQEIPFFESAKLKITYYRKNRRVDPDNISASKKFILDGLVQAGILPEDGWDEIKGFEESWKVDKENPRVEVEFEEG